MKKHVKVLVPLSVFCLLAIGLTWVNKSARVRSESQPQPPQTAIQGKSGLERINDKARAAKGADTRAIRSLTDEVMSLYGWDSAPSAVTDSIKDRLVHAEENFQRGTHKGISETEVSRAVNGFVLKFKTPEYSWTSPSEVREIRGRMLTLLPDFVGRGRAENGKAQSKKRGSRMAEMSPVEAAYTTMAVVYQKMYNPDFQLTQAERKAAWVEKHSKPARSLGNTESQPSPTVTPRQREMDEALKRIATTTPLQDLFGLPDKVMDALGIDRQKKEGK